MEQKMVWIFNNLTGKKLYVAVAHSIENLVLDVALSFSEKTLKTKFPEHHHDFIDPEYAIRMESLSASISFDFYPDKDENLKLNIAKENGANFVDIECEYSAPPTPLN